MNRLISVSKAAELLGVCSKTLREWDEEGKLVPVRTKGNHRRYKTSDINILLNNPPEQPKSDKVQVATYCRVSSNEQKKKGDLDRQVGRVLSYCVGKKYEIVASFEEVGSGMSDSRSKLKQLFKLIEEKKISKVVIEHKDRLCRFNFGFLKVFFESHGVEIEWIDEILGKSYEEELVSDMLSLMSCFSAKIYGKRSAENRKRKKLEKMMKVAKENAA